MLIDCPSCARSYHVSRAALGENGRHVVCQLCDTRWYAEVPRMEALATEEEIEALDVGQDVSSEAAVPATVAMQDAVAAEEIEQAAADEISGNEILCGEIPENTALANKALEEDTIIPAGPEPEAPPAVEIAQDEIGHQLWSSGVLAAPRGEIRAVRASKPQRRPAVPRPKPVRAARSSAGLRQMAAIAACLALVMGLIGKRSEIVRALPPTGALYAAIGLPVNIRNLEFGPVTAARADSGTSVVEVSGTIRNIGHHRVNVPRLTFEIRDASGAVLTSWSENAPKHSLASEEVLPFVTKTAALPVGYTDVAVRFSDAAPAKTLRDIVAQASR